MQPHESTCLEEMSDVGKRLNDPAGCCCPWGRTQTLPAPGSSQFIQVIHQSYRVGAWQVDPHPSPCLRESQLHCLHSQTYQSKNVKLFFFPKVLGVLKKKLHSREKEMAQTPDPKAFEFSEFHHFWEWSSPHCCLFPCRGESWDNSMRLRP